MKTTRAAAFLLAWCASFAGSPTLAFAQTPVEVTGEAILKHPIGQLAIKSAELMSARLIRALAPRSPGQSIPR